MRLTFPFLDKFPFDKPKPQRILILCCTFLYPSSIGLQDPTTKDLSFIPPKDLLLGPSLPASLYTGKSSALITLDTHWLSYLLWLLCLVVKEHRTHLCGDPIRGYYKSLVFLFTSPHLRSLVLYLYGHTTTTTIHEPANP